MWFLCADPEADQGGAAALQRGGGDAEVPAAPQHRPLPRLLEVHGEGPQMHHPGDGAHDVGHAQNVSISLFPCWFQRLENKTVHA